MNPRQAVILCGGYGTRLGSLTTQRPKPLLDVGGTPFLRILIEELARQGVSEILLLAAFEAEQIEAFASSLQDELVRPMRISVLREDPPAGTGGAIWQARHALNDRFYLLNGDSWFDILISDVARAQQELTSTIGALTLRNVNDSTRYGAVQMNGDRITAFAEKGTQVGSALINGGVYCFSKAIIDYLPQNGSLEGVVLPKLASEGLLAGIKRNAFFLDIGVPEDFAAAQTLVPLNRKRPAIFFDRDGVMNVDHGHVGTIDRLEWIPGAIDAVRLVNEAGWFSFVVTNQAGIGKGYYSEDDYLALRTHMTNVLGESGAHIDDERFCETHPEALHRHLRKESYRRKPNPGMLLELKEHWPIDWERSVMIGDKETDMEAARAANIPGVLFKDGNLADLVRSILANDREVHKDKGS